MNTLFSKYWQGLMSLALGIVVFLFWYVCYPHVLSYIEQFQLFLFDADYLLDHLKYPGGVSVYIAEFLVQFFISFTAGSVILAVLYVLVQRLTWMLAKREGASDDHYALSFLSPALLLAVMGDDNVMLGFVVGAILSLLACWGYSFVTQERSRVAVLIVAVPILFYLTSAASYMFIGYAIIRSFKNSGLSLRSVAFAIMLVVYTVVLVLAFYYASSFPLARIANGVGYYRYRLAYVSVHFLYLAFLVGLPFAIAAIPEKWHIKSKLVEASIEIACVVAVGNVLICYSYDPVKYRVIKYDYLLRTHNWDAIVALAEKEDSKTPIELSTINFALAMRGELGERMFEFNQRSSEGLLPIFGSESFSSIMSSEIFFKLGMVNTAERLVFEAQEASPSNQKSGRIMRRLVEVNIINGHYAVAERYLHVLEKTFAYRKWARNQLACLGDEQKIETHPLYGAMRNLRVTEDFFYSEREVDQMLGMLFVRNNFNRMALDYLLALELLTKDIDHFVEYIPLMSRVGSYSHIPRAFQEALCFAWAQNHNSFDGMPWSIDTNVKRDFSTFVSLYNTNKNAPQLKEGRLGKSFWSFILLSQN